MDSPRGILDPRGQMFDVEAEARVLRQRAGFEEEDAHGSVALASRLGLAVRRVDGHLLRSSDACLVRLHGRPEIFVRRMLGPERLQWVVGHELAELRLQELDYREEDVERQADTLAAALVMPRVAYRAAVREHGVAPASLAADFVVTQTAATLRLAEVHAVELAVVVTPAKVYARGEEDLVLPPEPDIRRGMLGMMPGLRAVRITDDRRRRAFVAAG